jgi:hypothetical protein
MTEDTRDALLDLAAVAVIGVAAYLIFRNPPLRRAAFSALKYGVGTAGPRLLWHETVRAWAETASDRTHRQLGSGA